MKTYHAKNTCSLTAFLLFTLVCCSSFVAAQEPAPVIVLEGATIFDGKSERLLRNRKLIIEGNTIRDIVSSNSRNPRGAEVINLRGKYIIPGLIDAHVHWLGWMGELALNHGVTSVLAMDNLDAEYKANSHSADSRMPRLYHTGGTIRLSNNASDVEIEDAVEEYLAREPDLARFPTHNDRTASVFRKAAELIHQRGYLIFGHAENAQASIRDGHDVIEHVWGFTQAAMTEDELEAFQRGEHLTWATFMTGRWDALDAMIEEAVDAGAYLNPTLLYEWGGMSERAEQRAMEEYLIGSDPRLIYYPEYTIPGGNLKESLLAKHRQIKNFSSRYGNTPYVSLLPEEDREKFEEGYQNVQQFIHKWVEAGGKIEAGTDSISGGMPGIIVHQEMQILVEAGLTPIQALMSTTSWSAEILEGKDGALGKSLIGSIEAGNYADLVVLSDNPAEDILNTQKIERVMKAGKWVEFGYTPEYYSFDEPSRSIAGATFAPVIQSIEPSELSAGDSDQRIVVTGNGFQLITSIRVNGISVKTDFINPRRLEFTLPARIVASPNPNPYRAPGPYQNVGIVGYRTVEVTAFNPPPEGGLSNAVELSVKPDGR